MSRWLIFFFFLWPVLFSALLQGGFTTLTELGKRDIDIPGWSGANGVKAKAAALAIDFSNTKMCFVAGTLVLAQINGTETLTAIETLQPLAENGAEVEVWARDEETGAEGWKRILAHSTEPCPQPREPIPENPWD